MATNTLAGSEINRLLNQNVNPDLLVLLNERVVEKKLMSFKKRAVSGEAFYDKAIIGGNFRLEGRPEGGYLPGMNPSTSFDDVSAGLKTQQAKYKRRYMYSKVDITGPMREAPKNDADGFGNLAELVLKDTARNLAEMMSRKLATSQNAVIGEIKSIDSTGANAVITLIPADATTSGYTTEAALAPWAGNRYIREGMVLDFVNCGGTRALTPWAALRTTRGRRVVSVSDDGSTCTITLNYLDAGHDLAAGDLITEFGERATTAISAQADYMDNLYRMMGIADAIQDGQEGMQSSAYMGDLAVASTKTFQSILLSNSTAKAWSPHMVNRLLEKISSDAMAGGEPDFLYCTPSVYRAGLTGFTTTTSFAGTSSTNVRSGLAAENPVRYNNPGKGEMINVGVSGAEVNTLGSRGSMKFFVSPFAPQYRMFAIQKGTLEVLEEMEPRFMDDDGLTLRNVTGKDEFAVIWKWYCTGVKCNHPRKNGYITGLLGDLNYDG